LCGLLALFATRSEPAPGGLRLDLEHHVIGASFSIDAPAVRGMYPGAVKPLTLKMSNAGRYDIRITNLTGTVVRTSKPGCAPTSTNLVIRRWLSPRSATVKAHGRSAMGSLPLYMPNTVANSCQNATFTIKLSGTGTQVRR
jgi:hypothetical protein